MEHVETIPELDHSSIRSSVQDTIGQPFRLMPKHMSRSVINVGDSVTSLDSCQSTLPQWWPHGRSHSGGWTFWVPSQLGPDKWNFWWWGLITSPNGWKLNPWQKLHSRMLRTSSGRVLCADLEYWGCLFLTMDDSLIIHILGNFVNNLESTIITPYPSTHRPMDKPK